MKSTQILLPLDESVGRDDVKKYRKMYKTIVAQVEKCGIENDKYGFDIFGSAGNNRRRILTMFEI